MPRPDRIGRTGRAGIDGDAVSLVCIDETRLLGDIERVLGHAIPSEVIEGFEPDPRIRPEPILRGGLGGVRPGGQRSIGVPRHVGSRPEGLPRPFTPRRDVTRPHEQALRSGASPRPFGGPQGRPAGPSRPGNRPSAPGISRRGSSGSLDAGRGYAPRRPGQGIGNGQPGGGAYSGHHAGGRSNSDRARSNPNHGPHRPAGRGIILPGERLARGNHPPG